MALVDYTLDTVVDPNVDMSIVANKITVITMRRDVVAYEYFDHGIGHFVAFEHLFDAQLNDTGSNGFNGVHVLANAIGNTLELETVDDHHVKVWVFNNNSNFTGVILREWHNGSSYQDTDVTTLSLNTPYYYTFKYIPATKVLTCKIYSDSGRTSLINTLSLTLQAAVTWRYRYSTSSRTSSAGEEWSGWLANTDLQEVVAAAQKIAGIFGVGRMGTR